MITKRLLIAAPAVVTLILLQSYFWVPSYDEQTRGNPDRLVNYITGSIGDANNLNPILSSDSASSTINSMVFEGLIDRDEELHFRGRLATSWDIYEEAYFIHQPSVSIPGEGMLSAAQLADYLEEAARTRGENDAELRAALENIAAVGIEEPVERTLTREIKPAGGTSAAVNTAIAVSVPARIRLRLHQVDQGLFDQLQKILGRGYFTATDRESLVSTRPAVDDTVRRQLADELIPATEHNPIIEFQLRPNVRFHDGHLFDAGDVKFTYEAIMNPKNLSPRHADYEPVKKVDILSPHRVRIVYKRLYSPAIGTWGIGILPEHRLNRSALDAEARRLGKDPETFSIRHSNFNRQPVGCGPYSFAVWKSDQFIQLNRFMEYWEGAPLYETYVYRVIPNPLTQEMEFYAGTLDSYGVQPQQVDRLKADPRFQSFSGTAFGYSYIGYNLRRKPFDDPRVRRALGMAIDTEQIIEFVLYGQGEPLTGPFVKQTEFYDHGIPALPYDPEGASRLLEEAGWKKNNKGLLEKNGKPFQFTLITNNGNAQRKAIMAVAQDAWKRIGIDVRTDLLEWSVFLQERVNKLDFDALILGWQMGIDPDLFQIWHSSQANPYQLNFVGFKDPEADDLIIKIRQEYDLERQIELCHRLHRIIADAQPYTFLYVGKWTAVLDKRIVIQESDETGNTVYKPIKATKTGNYAFHFNQWIKLAEAPEFRH